MRILDELADVFHALRGRPVPRAVNRSLAIRDVMPAPLRPESWDDLGRRLGCGLPPLRQDRWQWLAPHGLGTVPELARHVTAARGEFHRPEALSVTERVEAQVFVGVRDNLVGALNADPKEVTREARLKADLHAE